MIEASGLDVRSNPDADEIEIYLNGAYFCTSTRERIEDDMAGARAIREYLLAKQAAMIQNWNERGVVPELLRRAK
jgi:hypothetical protein